MLVGAENDLFITLDTTVNSSDGTVQPVTLSISSKIGPEGGMVEFPSSNVSLIVPKAAVSSDTTFCLKTYVHPDYLPLATSDDEVPLSPAFRLSSSLPRGHKFGNRLQLSLPVEVPRIDSSQSRPALVVPGFSLLSGARLVTDRLFPHSTPAVYKAFSATHFTIASFA